MSLRVSRDEDGNPRNLSPERWAAGYAVHHEHRFLTPPAQPSATPGSCADGIRRAKMRYAAGSATTLPQPNATER